MIEQFWTEQFVIIVVVLAYPINPPEKEFEFELKWEVVEQFWTEQFVIVVAALAYPINPPEKEEEEEGEEEVIEQFLRTMFEMLQFPEYPISPAFPEVFIFKL